MNNLKEIIIPFYTQCLTVNKENKIAEILGAMLAENFKSHASSEIKDKAQMIGSLQYFWKLIPNLKWDIQEILQDGNKVIVRSVATGSPKGDFFGLPLNGSKPFRIFTIDIHTVENGRITEVYHIEDWAAAMKQLKS
jgi:steroid delta-isomerase-like uncharacterized protein